MAKYVVTGKAGAGRSERPFEKQVEAASEKLAAERVMAQFGADGGIKRKAIKIDSVKKI